MKIKLDADELSFLISNYELEIMKLKSEIERLKELTINEEDLNRMQLEFQDSKAS